MPYIISDIRELVRVIDPDRRFEGVVYELWFAKEITHSYGIPTTSYSPYGELSISRDLSEFDKAISTHGIDPADWLPRVGKDLCDLELWILVYRDTLILGDSSDIKRCFRLVRSRLQRTSQRGLPDRIAL
jgi:hypothetical protein